MDWPTPCRFTPAIQQIGNPRYFPNRWIIPAALLFAIALSVESISSDEVAAAQRGSDWDHPCPAPILMTVVEVIQKSTEFLAKKGVDSPRLQVELLLAHVLELPRMKLYLNFDRTLSKAELSRLREMVVRRANREPLQHIIGSTSFCGLEISVNRHVLIPRPETEILAERGWLFLQAIDSSSPRALDLATGSGCIAISLAAHCPKAEVWAVDISPEALTTARSNAERLKVRDRVHFLESDLFAGVPHEAKFDLIVSNPPYIPTAEIATLDPEVRSFDPVLALDGGADGLRFYRTIAEKSGDYLTANGKLMLEFGDGQSPELRKIFEQAGWGVAIEKDYTGRERFLLGTRRE